MKRCKILLGALIFVFTPIFASTGWLGVYVEKINKPMKVAIGVDYGILVTRVAQDSPAELGGIKEGDVILKINDEKIRDYDDLKSIIEDKPNEKVELRLQRGGKLKTLKLTLGEREEKEHRWGKKWEFWHPEGRKRIRIGPLRIDIYEEEIEELKREIKELRKNLKHLFKDLKKEYKEIPKPPEELPEEEFEPEEFFKEFISPEETGKI